MISQTAEYALRAVVCLADHAGKPLVTPQIAKMTHVPAGYLSKVLQMLGRAEVVRSQRGLHGGFLLARPAEDITVLDVVNAVDPVKRIGCCPLGIKAHGEGLCALHRRLDDATAAIEKAFDDTTIAEILTDKNPSKPLCSGRD